MTENDFRLTLAGSAVDSGQMDVKELTPALLALASIQPKIVDSENSNKVL